MIAFPSLSSAKLENPQPRVSFVSFGANPNLAWKSLLSIPTKGPWDYCRESVRGLTRKKSLGPMQA